MCGTDHEWYRSWVVQFMSGTDHEWYRSWVVQIMSGTDHEWYRSWVVHSGTDHVVHSGTDHEWYTQVQIMSGFLRIEQYTILCMEFCLKGICFKNTRSQGVGDNIRAYRVGRAGKVQGAHSKGGFRVPASRKRGNQNIGLWSYRPIIIIISLTSIFFQNKSRVWTAASQQH